jgi:hypothetical protein
LEGSADLAAFPQSVVKQEKGMKHGKSKIEITKVYNDFLDE